MLKKTFTNAPIKDIYDCYFICPNCRKYNKESRSKCYNCGTDLKDVTEGFTMAPECDVIK